MPATKIEDSPQESQTRNSEPRIAYYSRWLVTSECVIEDAALELAGHSITFVGAQSDYAESKRHSAEVTDLGASVIIPGLINCHVHTNFPHDVELTFESGSMIDWVQAALSARETRSLSQQPEDVRLALTRMRETGVVAIGEIANDFVSLEPIVESGMICRFFAEGLGFPGSLAGDVFAALQRDIAEARRTHDLNYRVSLYTAPHAPYSCSARLIQLLTRAPGGDSTLSTIHLAENQEEVTLLRYGSGPWRERLRAIGKDDSDWSPPGLSPVQYLRSLDVLGKRLLLAHVIRVDESDIDAIAQSGATVVLCPASNAFIGVGVPPLPRFLERSIPLALGTDSLASNTDLDLFAEMRQLRALFPDVSRRKLFSLATTGGAAALGLGDDLGELKVGCAPGALAVDLTAGGATLDFDSAEELFDRLITVGADSLRKLSDADIVRTNASQL